MRKALFVLISMISVFAIGGCGSGAADYKSDLQSTADGIIENISVAEELLNAYTDVWDYSIKRNGAIPIEEMSTVTELEQDDIENYFEINTAGNIPDDFSLNVHSLIEYYEDNGQLEEIKDISSDTKEKITDLNDPPKDYERTYDELLDMYTYSEEYIEMAVEPTGSLQEFNEAKNQLTNDISSKYKRIEATIPKD